MPNAKHLLVIAIAAPAAILLAAPPASAQSLPTHRIPAALALEAVGEAVAACARQGYNETAVLVDVDGVRQAVLRGDGTGAHTLDSANDKAYTSASFKTDSSALVERAKTVPIAPLLAKLPHLLLFGGGVVIKIGDEVVGAIGTAGAPGGDLDENCARAGLDKIRDRLK
ncbi:MAG: heme-binding protein [Alphaproteobacteria bacterium]|nr:heme-binding protein [Alphaproteobacteria bacterium]